MKNIIRKSLGIFLVLFLMIALVGCSSSSGGSSKVTPASLAGTYDLVSMRDAGTDESDDSTLYAEDQGITGVLTLNNDGTGTYVFMGQSVDLAYDTEALTITYDENTDTFAYADGVLEWTMGEKVHSFKKQ